MNDELLRRLCDEIDRISERYPESVEALQALQDWAMEENVPVVK